MLNLEDNWASCSTASPKCWPEGLALSIQNVMVWIHTQTNAVLLFFASWDIAWKFKIQPATKLSFPTSLALLDFLLKQYLCYRRQSVFHIHSHRYSARSHKYSMSLENQTGLLSKNNYHNTSLISQPDQHTSSPSTQKASSTANIRCHVLGQST